MRNTKIICTLGPATDDINVLRELILEGMNVARINFSHGKYEEHLVKINNVKKLRKEIGLPIALLLDTKGPEVRIGTFENGKVELQIGQLFTLTTREVTGNQDIVSVTYKDLPKDVQVGSTILIDDGLVDLIVVEMNETDIVCRVNNQGFVSNNKGVNLPGAQLSMPFISERDQQDIIFGIKNGFDFIAASFVRNAQDILDIRKILDAQGCHFINVIAKIENMQGVENIDEIIRVSDGVMVARGDMGVEIPMEDVPVIQKMIIKKVANAGKQVITATQMLDSMMKNPRPTRAETTDVANAIYDGTGAIMLSGETAAGLYPVESLKTMVKIAVRTEQAIDYVGRFRTREYHEGSDVTSAISRATCSTVIDLNAAAIITVTKSGRTAHMVSKYRPNCQIIACSTFPNVCRQMNLAWGVTPLLMEEEDDTNDLFDHAVKCAEKAGFVHPGEITVITAGVPLGMSGTTNLIKVHVVGDILLSGSGITNNIVTGDLCVCGEDNQALTKFKDNDILVIKETNNQLLPIMKRASALIVEKSGSNSHAAIVGLTLNIPVIVGAKNATQMLKCGAVVTVDAARGVVCCNQ